MKVWDCPITVESVAFGGVRLTSAPFSATYHKTPYDAPNMIRWSISPGGLFDIMYRCACRARVDTYELACLMRFHESMDQLTASLNFTVR